MLIALQRVVMPNMRLWGVVPQIVLALCAASGVAGGPDRAAWFGFVVGLMFDLGTGSPLGQHALAYGLAGYVSGVVNVVAVDPHWWLSMAFVALGGAVGELTVPIVSTFVSDGGWHGQRLSTILPVIAITCGVLSVLFIPLSRWCLAIRKKTWKAINR
ncbi:MAG: rod shape-determining protein MreD [Actinobacteria bacterium]|nr:rod shape-determining protein MreD [Actinomycetota bacterium]